MGLIALEGMRFYAYHGFYKEEQKIGGYYVVDVYIDTRLSRKSFQDELSSTVNYETVHFICKAAMKKPTKLIEAVAARIILGIKKQFDRTNSVKVRIKKEHPPLNGEVKYAIVELDDDFAPTCNRCRKPLVCFDKPEGCWCINNNIDGGQLARFQSQYYKCKCLECPLN